MGHVTGLGGVFFRADDPAALYSWYERHLGLKREEGGVMLRWRDAEEPEREGMTVWAPFEKDTGYFGPSGQQLMLNYRVRDLDGLLDALRAEGVRIDEKREDHDYGRFAWIYDLEGNKVELWEPPAGG